MLMTVIGTGVAGLLLLFLEMFLPGLIAGVVGAILLIICVVLAFTDLGAEAGMTALLISAASSGGLWWWWATRFQETRFGKSMTLSATIAGDGGTTALAQLAGQEGEAISALRPAGTVTLEGRRVDAITDGEFLDVGTRVRVIRSNGMSVVVRKA